MRTEDFAPQQHGFLKKTYAGDLAYYPPPVPRDYRLEPDQILALSAADRALGELSGVGKRLGNPHMLIRPYLHREAILSLRIEGTQSSLSELILFEAGAPTARPDDMREVVNYVIALEEGVDRLPKVPISLRLIRDLHKTLLHDVRGEDKTPGDFRRKQNWIGAAGTTIEQAVFVPPPPEALDAVLDDWEKFIHEKDATPPLLRCALIHYQFETIHPFIDGNGRIGRLLMPLFLISEGHLSQPLLYLSAYFDEHRREYVGALMEGRLTGNMTPWISMFLAAVETQAKDAANRADRLTELETDFRQRIARSRSSVTHRLIDELFSAMYVSAASIARKYKVTPASAGASIDTLVEVGILKELTGKKHGRIYAAGEMLAVLEPGRKSVTASDAAAARESASVARA
jgi:Fic family protein